VSRPTWGLPPAPASPPPAASAPTTCPACRSTLIATTAKSPDATSYWRCGSCGEIWNAARREDHDSHLGGWRRPR
jgi:predicted Zn finger-like uncharacterized protein